MTPVEERPITQRVAQRPAFDLREVRKARFRDLWIRFVAGALTSVVAGAITLAFGSRIGGIMLAFPAILAASLTLIAEVDGVGAAREDARGAVIGGCAMAVFAGIAALTLGKFNSALALLLATAGWLVGAVGGYFVVWFR